MKHFTVPLRLSGYMKTGILALSLVAALFAGAFTVTQVHADNAPHAGAAPGRLLRRLADELNLTADQRTQIKSVLAGEKAALAPLVASVHDARKELRTALRADSANETAVRAAAAKVGAAEADLAVERMKVYGQIAPILSPAQRAQLAELQQRADQATERVLGRLGSGLVN
jgi:Spy/CpxP family protein refolding chaperone